MAVLCSAERTVEFEITLTSRLQSLHACHKLSAVAAAFGEQMISDRRQRRVKNFGGVGTACATRNS